MKNMSNNPESSIAEIRGMSGDHKTIRIQDPNSRSLQTDTDDEYQHLKGCIIKGFPDHRSELPEAIKRYWNARDQLTLDDDLIMYGCILVIPTKMQGETLAHIHESRQGSLRTKERARLTVYWPGIDNDIDNVVLTRKKCLRHAPTQQTKSQLYQT